MAAIDVEKFTEHLRSKADNVGYGKGRCAYFVRQALAAGGYKPATWPVHAKDWGPSMLRARFHTVHVEDLSTYRPMKGDVAVIQATSNRKSGHIQGFDGKTGYPISSKRTDSGPAKNIARRLLPMSSTVLKHALVCVSFAFVIPAVRAMEPQGILSCEAQKFERAALKQAPKTVRRVSKHVLEITTTKGIRRFIDKPPHDTDEMAGVHWRYCGFDAHAKAHLIEMIDESSYSGDLLLEETGQQIRAGHTVLFSPTRNNFLAIEQQAGVDGENWAVHDISGKTIWTGYAGTIAKVDGMEMVLSTFERPSWTKAGALTAHFVCASSKAQGTVSLVRSSSSGWNWSGHARCP